MQKIKISTTHFHSVHIITSRATHFSFHPFCSLSLSFCLSFSNPEICAHPENRRHYGLSPSSSSFSTLFPFCRSLSLSLMHIPLQYCIRLLQCNAENNNTSIVAAFAINLIFLHFKQNFTYTTIICYFFSFAILFFLFILCIIEIVR